MRLKTLIVAVAVAAILPVTALADTATPADKANGARACQALQTSMGATFASTYATFGKCVSAWTRAEHQDRHEAQTACAAEQPAARNRGALQRCVQAKQKAARAAERQATVNAARQCKAERGTMGEAPFAAKYGGKANAFGKCVSKLAAAKAQES